MAPPVDTGVAGARSLAAAREFASGLLDPGSPPPATIARPRGAPVAKRYAVYRNNVTVSLVDSLAEIFPAVRRIVGGEFFTDLARVFVRQHPPRSRLLFEYGADFAGFLERFEPARRLVYLADVARIERAWLDAFHAADAEPLGGEELQALPPEDLPAARFAPHPAMRIVRSHYAAHAIFIANRGEQRDGRRIDAGIAEDTLVTRPRARVLVRPLPPGVADFIGMLGGGGEFASAIEKGMASAGFDPGAAIALVLEAGVFRSRAASAA